MDSASKNPWRQSLLAAKANGLPGLLLQVFALLLVVAYYFWPQAKSIFDELAQLKVRWGFGYSLIATSIFGGVIPFFFMRWNPTTRGATPWSHFWFYTLFWGYKGLEVDALYRFQGLLFGRDHQVLTIVCKVLFDQFVYSLFWSAPFGLVFYHWKESGFGWARIRSVAWIKYLRGAMPSALLSTWGIWVPTVAVIYCLPESLQVPLFNIVLCFFVLIWATLTRKPEPHVNEASAR